MLALGRMRLDNILALMWDRRPSPAERLSAKTSASSYSPLYAEKGVMLAWISVLTGPDFDRTLRAPPPMPDIYILRGGEALEGKFRVSLIEATTVKLLDSESKIETTLRLKKEESSPSGTWIGKEIIRFLFLSRSAFTVVHGNEISASIDGPRSFG